MTHDDLLQRSMDVAPEDWLDHLVTERVVAHVQRTCAAPSPAPLPAAETRAAFPAAGALARARLVSARVPFRAGWAWARAWLGKLGSPEARMLLWRDGDQRG